MPLTLIQYKPSRFTEEGIQMIASQMPKIVASALHSPRDGEAASLVPNDIEVWCTESGKLDVNTKDLEIIIWAQEFPDRKATLERRKDEIIRDVRKLFSKNGGGRIPGFVWVLLQPTAFGTL